MPICSSARECPFNDTAFSPYVAACPSEGGKSVESPARSQGCVPKRFATASLNRRTLPGHSSFPTSIDTTGAVSWQKVSCVAIEKRRNRSNPKSPRPFGPHPGRAQATRGRILRKRRKSTEDEGDRNRRAASMPDDVVSTPAPAAASMICARAHAGATPFMSVGTCATQRHSLHPPVPAESTRHAERLRPARVTFARRPTHKLRASPSGCAGHRAGFRSAR